MATGTFLQQGIRKPLGIASGGTDNYVMTATGSETIQGEANLTFDGSTLTVTGAIGVASTNKITFGDAASFIHQSADGTLTIDGEGTIDLNASTRVDVSGDIKVGGEVQTAAIGFTDGDNAITIADGGGITAAAGITSTAAANAFGATTFANGTGVVIGHTGKETISTGDGDTDLVPELQVIGTAMADSSAMLACFSTTATRAAAPTLALVKGGHATIGSHTVVTDDEVLGNIIAYGDDGTDLEAPAASIQFVVDGTPGTGDMPGSIEFHTTTDGGETLAERMRVTSGGSVLINETSNANVTLGLTINQGANDDEILALKSSDVNHSVSGEAEIDTYATFRKREAAYGGLRITGLSQSNRGFAVYSIVGSGNATKSAAGFGAVNFHHYTRSGSGATVMGADENLFSIHNAGNAAWLVDEDGDVHYDGTTNAEHWDDYDDIALLDTVRAVTTNNYGKTFSSWTEENKKVLHDSGVITFNDDGHHFVSTKGLNGLLVDSIRQLYQHTTRHMDELNSRNETLEARLMALEGAK